MIAIPAMDLMGGRCVRLSQGAYDQRTTYPTDPAEMARIFADGGVRLLHVVDLDGARTGSPKHLELLRTLASDERLAIDFSGGIRTADDVQRALDAGAAFVAIGSMAASEPETVLRWAERFGAERFLLGADTRNGTIATHGWQDSSKLGVEEFLAPFLKVGMRRVFCTDIQRDGMLQGPATELYARLLAQYPELELIASGGIRDVADLRSLEEVGCAGAIIGKALYEGHIDLKDLGPWL
jgi:phosphoribosylformimino-5-aminoimidazole carboxamide ribotide isomerase